MFPRNEAHPTGKNDIPRIYKPHCHSGCRTYQIMIELSQKTCEQNVSQKMVVSLWHMLSSGAQLRSHIVQRGRDKDLQRLHLSYARTHCESTPRCCLNFKPPRKSVSVSLVVVWPHNATLSIHKFPPFSSSLLIIYDFNE